MFVFSASVCVTACVRACVRVSVCACSACVGESVCRDEWVTECFTVCFL